MKDHVRERVIRVAECYINSEMTIRGIAKLFGISKSTVHNDLIIRSKEVRPEFYNQIIGIAEKHKNNRHINGGIATKRKFEQLRALKEIEGQ